MNHWKITLAAACLSITCCGFAASKPAPAFNGLFISAGLNSASRSTHFTMTRWTNSAAFFSNNGSVTTVGANIALGYQKLLHRWLLGGKITARYLPGQSSGTALNNINTPRISTPCLIGLEATPGYLLTANTALYGIIGLEWTQFRIHQHFDSSQFSFTRHQTGLGLGIGMQTALSQHLLIQLAYLYIHYARFQHPDTANALTMAFTPHLHIMTLALAYDF
jgi:opacity protein-like surface antigen